MRGRSEGKGVRGRCEGEGVRGRSEGKEINTIKMWEDIFLTTFQGHSSSHW